MNEVATGVGARRTRAEILALVAVIVGTVAIYSRVLTARFAFDDNIALRLHPGVQGRLSWQEIIWRDYWGKPIGSPDAIGTWRPLATLTFWFDRHVGGGRPLAYHATNVALFVATLVAADAFLRRWARDALSPAARIATIAAFAAMAIHVDVVPPIMGRTEILALLLSLVGLRAACAPDISTRHVVIGALALLGAQLSKESALPMPILAAILAFRHAPAERRKYALAFGGAALATVAGVLAFRAGRLPFSKPDMVADNPLVTMPFFARLPGAIEVLARYLEHLFAPFDLCPDYSYSGVVLARGLAFRPIVGGAVALALAAVLIGCWSRRPRLAEAVLGFGASYVAVSHVVLPGSAVMADRLFFGPSLWVAILVGLGVNALIEARRAYAPLVALCAGVFVLGQATLTLLSSAVWHDLRTLGVYGVRACSNVARLRVIRADGAFEHGEVEEGAWNLLVDKAIWRRYPAPVSENDYPPAWEDEPMAARMAHLRERLGRDALAIVCRQAEDEATTKKFASAAFATRYWCALTLGTPLPVPR